MDNGELLAIISYFLRESIHGYLEILLLFILSRSKRYWHVIKLEIDH